MNLQPYSHRVNYYETDQMSVVHHSNYIRWFEEARIDYMRLNGITVSNMEALGIQIPVTGVSCEYTRPARFDDRVEVYTSLSYYNGIRMVFHYTVKNSETGALLVSGESRHCFLDSTLFKPVSLKKKLPEIHDNLTRLYQRDSSRTEE